MKKILVIVIATIALVSTAKSQWTKCGDLFGGNIHCFVSTDTELYAGTTSGVYYTNKSTAEWKNTSLYYLDILSLAVNDMFVFAGTSEGSVYRSSNKGDKWLKVNEGLANLQITSLLTIGSNLLAGTRGKGVYISSNNGEKWRAVNSLINYSNVWSFAVKGSKIFIGTNEGIYFSEDMGEKWTSIPQFKKIEVKSLLISGKYIFAGTSNHGIFRSEDNGIQWIEVNSRETENVIVNSLERRGNDVFAATEKGVFISDDYGKSWLGMSKGLTTLNISSLFINADNLYAGSVRGLFRSINGGIHWQLDNSGLNKFAFTITKSGQNLIVGTTGGIYHSSDNGDNWIADTTELLNKYVSAFIVKDTNIYAGTYDGLLYLSTNDGVSWKKISSQLGRYVQSFAFIGTNFFAGSYADGVYRSTDAGIHWTFSGYDMGHTITSLAVIKSNLFAGNLGFGLYLSADTGKIWKNLTWQYITFMDLAVIDTVLFTGTEEGGVFMTTNNGKNWNPVRTGLTNYFVNCLIASGNKLLAATGDGIFISSNNGTNWFPLDIPGLPKTRINSLKIDGMNLYAVLGNLGVWKTDISDFLKNQSLSEIHENQYHNNSSPTIICYPNPAGNSLTINSTSLPFNEFSPVTYTLSTLTGNKLMQFEQTEKQFSVSLNGIASGVYALSAAQGGKRAVVMVTVVE